MTLKSFPRVFTSINELKAWRNSVSGTIGFVPTMGALHEGHATLLRQSKTKCQISILSIFVNPTQFGPNEDLANYPRTFERDLAIAATEGVDFVFAPSVKELYPDGYSTFVEETQVSKPLCGKFRPGHFQGVTTIVLKLLNLVQPKIAFFGLKDVQQYFVLQKMVQDLNLSVQVEGVPTVRESDGLALSSRNMYLSQEERRIAPELYRALKDAHHSFQLKEKTIPFILEKSVLSLQAKGFRVQYFDILSLPHFLPIEDEFLSQNKPYLLAAAAYLGKTRLIDNMILA